jgi:molybdopterin molybdotransferase
VRDLLELTPIDHAQKMIMNAWNKDRRFDKVDLYNALDYQLAEPIVATENVPSFDRSTVDGYAVLAEDTFGASESLPMLLNIVDHIAMGKSAVIPLNKGEAAVIPTGGMLPSQANAVVMVEHTEEFSETEIFIQKPVSPNENVVKAGEDVSIGEVVLPAKHRLRPQDLGVLASLGIIAVNVYKPYKVGIISTGSELVEAKVKPELGQVRDINSYALYGLVKKSYGIPTIYPIVQDDYEALLHMSKKALQENDFVILSGGSSVGTRDYTLDVLEALGDPGLLLHGIPVKPGKPTLVASAKGKLIFGLPGHPVSAMVVYQLLVHPLIADGQYQRNLLPVIIGQLTRNLPSATGRQDHIRVRLNVENGQILVEPVLGKSGLITTLVKAHGEIVIPEAKEGLRAGELVEVRIF